MSDGSDRYVWLVWWSCYDDSEVWGVFDSEQAAEDAAAEWMTTHLRGLNGERLYVERQPLNPTAEQVSFRREHWGWDEESHRALSPKEA